MVGMIVDSSVVIRNMLPKKLKYLGSFFIPFQIGTMNFEIPLYDLGASSSLMPLYVCKKLQMGEMKLTYTL